MDPKYSSLPRRDSSSRSSSRPSTVAASNTVKVLGSWSSTGIVGADEFTWHSCPQYRLSATGNGIVPLTVTLDITTTTKEHIGVYLIPVPKVSKRVEITANTSYIAIPQIKRNSTGAAPKFTMSLVLADVASTLTVTKLKRFHTQEVRGEWNRLNCGGQLGSDSFTNNPQYKIDPLEPGRVTLILSQRDIALTTEIGLYVFRVPKCATVGKVLNIYEEPIVSTTFNSRFETFSDFDVDPQFHYYVIPATKSKGADAPFLLRAFGTKPFQFHLSNIGVKQGEWAGASAGGSPPLSATWMNNKQYLLKLSSRNSLTISLIRLKPEAAGDQALAAPSPAPMSFLVLPTMTDTPRVWIEPQEIESTLTATEPTLTDEISQRFDLGEIGAQTQYAIVPCLKNAGDLGRYRLEVRNNSEAPIDLEDAGAFWRSAVAEGSWTASSSGGSAEFSSWMLNPQYTFTSPAPSTYFVSLSCSFDALHPIGFYLFRIDAASQIVSRVFEMVNEVGTAEFRRTNQISRRVEFVAGERIIIVPATFRPGIIGNFNITVYSTQILAVTSLDIQNTITSIKDVWPASRRGGGLKNSSWRQNQQFRLKVSGLDRPVEATVVLCVDNGGSRSSTAIATYVVACKDPDRQCLVIKRGDLLGGHVDFKESCFISRISIDPKIAESTGYLLIPCTKTPYIARDTAFSLSIFLDTKEMRSRAVADLVPTFGGGQTGWKCTSISGQWTPTDSGGCAENKTSWPLNRVFGVKTTQPDTKLLVILLKPAWVVAGMYILKSNVPKVRYILATSEFAHGSKEVAVEVLLKDPGEYSIIPCTFVAGEVGNYNLLVHSDKPVEINQGARKPTGRQNCINEILKTEKGYAQDLASAVDKFLRPIASQGPSIMTNAEISSIFSNIAALKDLHMQLSAELEVAAKSDDPVFGPIFLKYAPMLKIYTDYYRTYFSGITTMETCLKRSSTAAFLQGLNSNFEATDPGRRTLRDLLIAPVQRIPRYVMLLQQLGKLTTEDHEDHGDVYEAASRIEAVLAELNLNLRKFEGLKKVVELEDSLITRQGDRYPLVSATRFHLRDGIVKIVRGPGAPDNRHLFIFNDLLLIANKSKEKFVVEWSFTSGLRVEIASQDPPQLRCGAFVVQLASSGEIQMWMESFKHATILTQEHSGWESTCFAPKIPLVAQMQPAYMTAPTSPSERIFQSKRATSSFSAIEEDIWNSVPERSSTPTLAYSAESEAAPSLLDDDDEQELQKPEIPVSSWKPNAKMVYDYSTSQEGHLSVRKGQLIFVEYAHEHWAQAKLENGQSGWVPSNYLTTL